MGGCVRCLGSSVEPEAEEKTQSHEVSMEKVVENYPRPSRIWVEREGERRYPILIDPNHPRFSMSMDRRVKAKLSEEDRYQLAEDLMKHFDDAMKHWADAALTVYVPRFDLHVDISDNPDDPGKMLVRPG